MQENIETQSQEIKSENTNLWTRNIVNDPSAPAYYSLRAIYAFSVVFTVIFGAVLFSSNLKDKKAKLIVLGFGLLYTTFVVILVNLIPFSNSAFTMAFNAGGAVILTHLFWNKYIGKETKFRTKPVWKPLIISILVTIPFLLAMIYG